MGLQLDVQNLSSVVSEDEIKSIAGDVKKAHNDLHNKTGAGNDYLGWVDLPSKIEDSLISELENLAAEVQKDSDCVISVGIGGSYLGILSTISFVGKTKIPLYYAGHHMSSDDMFNLLETIKDKNVTLIVISKSGTTTEPAVAFRILKQELEKKYSQEELKKRIICVTDSSKGALRQTVDNEGCRSYIIPDDVGGRFSVLTPVGLVPLALAGIDIRSLVKGARDAQKEYANDDVMTNTAYRYAASRNLLYKKGKVIEMLATFYPKATYVAEWWKQLFGESEGKGGEGIFPASTVLSTDLHSMGQLMQDGMRNIFETFLMIDKPRNDIIIPTSDSNIDNFNCIAGKGLDYVNKQAYKATAAAHLEGGVPNMTITLDAADAYHCGQLYYFFEKAVGISGYLLGVNPFDQPGVEAYKSKMFALLGRK